MKPIKFKEQNTTFAENQSAYLPLPAFRNDSPQGEVISCWKFSFKERIKILFFGKLWVSLMMFGKPLTPSFFTVNKSDVFMVNPTFTWLTLTNYIVQFFFFRVFKSVEKGKVLNYGILYWVLPLTGWWNSYKILNKSGNLKFWHWK